MRVLTILCAVLLGVLPAPAASVALDPAGLDGLVWHAESLDGDVLTSRDADEPVNPASVVKVATTIAALERLGPGHRYETRFEVGANGDLVVRGAGDPDFHWENAFRVAERLVDQGVRRVSGDLVVVPPLWFGWEGGAEREVDDSAERARLMGERLRVAFDPSLWPSEAAQTWARVGGGRAPVGVPIAGRVRVDALAAGSPRVVHVSKPLTAALRRFNAYSNNDIERIGDALGGPAELARVISAKVGGPAVRFETTSGLGVNRMTPRQLVALLRALSTTSASAEIPLAELLPTAGCDPGTLAQFFPRLSSPPFAGSVTGKTGSLTVTDGGVASFAGYAETRAGTVLFAVVAPRSGKRLDAARRAEERFVTRLIDALGGPRRDGCAPELPAADSDTQVVGR